MKDVPTMIKRTKRTTIKARLVRCSSRYSIVSPTLLRVCTYYVMMVKSKTDKHGNFINIAILITIYLVHSRMKRWHTYVYLCELLNIGQYYHNQLEVEVLATSRHNITLDSEDYEEFCKYAGKKALRFQGGLISKWRVSLKKKRYSRIFERGTHNFQCSFIISSSTNEGFSFGCICY